MAPPPVSVVESLRAYSPARSGTTAIGLNPVDEEVRHPGSRDAPTDGDDRCSAADWGLAALKNPARDQSFAFQISTATCQSSPAFLHRMTNFPTIARERAPLDRAVNVPISWAWAWSIDLTSTAVSLLSVTV
jgi:hypothetical protein